MFYDEIWGEGGGGVGVKNPDFLVDVMVPYIRNERPNISLFSRR